MPSAAPSNAMMQEMMNQDKMNESTAPVYRGLLVDGKMSTSVGTKNGGGKGNGGGHNFS